MHKKGRNNDTNISDSEEKSQYKSKSNVEISKSVIKNSHYK